MRAFQDVNKPKSDDPTASRESFRIFLSLTATQLFELKALDVTSAFLQSEPIERNIIIQHPKEYKKKGFV